MPAKRVPTAQEQAAADAAAAAAAEALEDPPDDDDGDDADDDAADAALLERFGTLIRDTVTEVVNAKWPDDAPPPKSLPKPKKATATPPTSTPPKKAPATRRPRTALERWVLGLRDDADA